MASSSLWVRSSFPLRWASLKVRVPTPRSRSLHGLSLSPGCFYSCLSYRGPGAMAQSFQDIAVESHPRWSFPTLCHLPLVTAGTFSCIIIAIALSRWDSVYSRGNFRTAEVRACSPPHQVTPPRSPNLPSRRCSLNISS